MSETLVDIELAKKEDVPVSLTTTQMNNIKSQFAPSSMVNVNVKPYTIYSPNEQVVGEWQETRDGILKKKPLYAKNIKVSINNGSTTDISSLNCEYIGNYDIHVKYKGTVSGGTLTYPWYKGNQAFLQYTYGSGGSVVALSADNSNEYIVDSTYDVYVNIEYTKTTDQWENVE